MKGDPIYEFLAVGGEPSTGRPATAAYDRIEFMTVPVFAAIVWAVSFLAGFLGSLTGLGGGVVLVPALALLFGVDIRYAVGASLVSVIATSSGAAAAYVREGYTN